MNFLWWPRCSNNQTSFVPFTVYLQLYFYYLFMNKCCTKSIIFLKEPICLVSVVKCGGKKRWNFWFRFHTSHPSFLQPVSIYGSPAGTHCYLRVNTVEICNFINWEAASMSIKTGQCNRLLYIMLKVNYSMQTAHNTPFEGYRSPGGTRCCLWTHPVEISLLFTNFKTNCI